jgi:hypothetical protein
VEEEAEEEQQEEEPEMKNSLSVRFEIFTTRFSPLAFGSNRVVKISQISPTVGEMGFAAAGPAGPHRYHLFRISATQTPRVFVFA